MDPEKRGQVQESSEVSAVGSEGVSMGLVGKIVFITEPTVEGQGELFRFTIVPNPFLLVKHPFLQQARVLNWLSSRRKVKKLGVTERTYDRKYCQKGN